VIATSARNTGSAIGVIGSAIGGMIITNATGVTIETACGSLSELHFEDDSQIKGVRPVSAAPFFYELTCLHSSRGWQWVWE
jgi:hypothetical protein